MQALMNRLLGRYGMQAVITTENGSVTARVFFHSVNSRSWQNMEKVFLPLGEIPRGQYICVFPAGLAVAAGDTVTVGGRDYRVCRVEEMAMHTGTVYQWSLCMEKGGEDTWGSNG